MEKTIQIKGMHCKSCGYVIEKEVSAVKGVKSIKVDQASNSAVIDFDQAQVSLKDIGAVLQKHGYSISFSSDSSDGSASQSSESHPDSTDDGASKSSESHPSSTGDSASQSSESHPDSSDGSASQSSESHPDSSDDSTSQSPVAIEGPKSSNTSHSHGKHRKNKHEKIVEKTINIKGMHCRSCEAVIEKEVSQFKGVRSVKVDYASSEAVIRFDKKRVSLDDIDAVLEKHGYSIASSDRSDRQQPASHENADSSRLSIMVGVSVLIILYGLYLVLSTFIDLTIPAAGNSASFALLFLVGLLTGFHCIGMCGSFVLSYTAKNAAEGNTGYTQHFQYILGKLLSYSVIGGFFGFIGSVFQFSNTLRAFIALFAGIFLILYGINMLNIFPVLRKLQLRLPGLHVKSKTPLVIGLLNGLFIACGPLQALYIYAMGTGSPIDGFLSLFFFGLGTSLPMLGFGISASNISHSLTSKILKFSGVIVVILGLIMLNNSLALFGTGYDFTSLKSSLLTTTSTSSSTDSGDSGVQIIQMSVTRKGFEPNSFTLKRGVPVIWRINGVELNGCNRNIQVPKYNLKFEVKPGFQDITFTPTESGVVSWSCWMGMLRGNFIVQDPALPPDKQPVSPPVPSGGSCGGGGGGCGCGAR